MFPSVTAILVVHQGGDRLRRTLEAIRGQESTPTRLVAVLIEADADARAQLHDAAPDALVQLNDRLSFGDAVRAAVRTLDAPADDRESLWLLTEDTAPERGALTALIASLETARSVAVAGPKLVDWERGDRILSLGRSMTRSGLAVPLVDDELDQGQHDGLSDVLGTHPAGVLVRHTVFRQLEGFDHGLPVVDDGLDLGIRARLAGHRVAVAPGARIAFAEAGIAGPPAPTRAAIARRTERTTRRAALHRRLVYAPAAVVPLHWLSFLPLAVVRSVIWLLAKAPGRIAGEFGAALAAMFSASKVARARGTLRAARATGWSAIAPLRIQPDEMRRRRRLAAEERRARARGRNEELQFLATGGWVLLVSILASAVMFTWLLGATGIAGGGLLPLSNGVAELWRNAAYGWRDIGAGFVGAADPFQAVLAVAGSLTFWSPSMALLLLWVVAMPAAALGAWFAASRVTDGGALRALVALGWMAAPPFLMALADGRPGAVLAHVLLGWLAFAAFGARTSWAAAGTASLLFAAVVASAPSLVPALLVAWVVAMVFGGRGVGRLALLPVPAAALAAPLVVAQVARGTLLGLFADPGVPVPGRAPTHWELALGLPRAGVAGWPDIVQALGWPVDPRWVLSALLAPLALAALAAAASGRLRAAALALGTAALGFATAVAAAHLAVAVTGEHAVPVWSGAGQSLMWLGLLIAAALALAALPRGGAWGAAFVLAAATAAVLPLAVSFAQGAVALRPADARTLPAFVTAQARQDPRVTTLRLAAQVDGGLRATLERGAGTTLDDQSTYAQTATKLTGAEQTLASIAGNLASRSGFDAKQAIDRFGVTYVLLAPEPRHASPGQAQVGARAQLALDGDPALVAVGRTDFGMLWRFADARSPSPVAAIPARPGAPLGGWIAIGQFVVFGIVLLLSIPTGAGRELRPAAARRRPVRRGRDEPAPAETAATESATTETAAIETAPAAASDDGAEPVPSEPRPAGASEAAAADETTTEDEGSRR